MEVQCLIARMLDSGSSGLVLNFGQVTTVFARLGVCVLKKGMHKSILIQGCKASL